jgi:hypothetical protein
MTSAVAELARVRKLQAPALLARLQVVADNPPASPDALTAGPPAES